MSVIIAAAIVAGVPAGAAQETQLRAVRGIVGYQLAVDAPFDRVIGSFLLQDNQFAITRAASNALLVLTDSSEVALGESTSIQVGAITQAASDAPKAITLLTGAMRFAIRHPAGAQSNYRFLTPTSQVAVRGTIGLLSTGPNGDVISCLDCAPGDVSLTAGGNTVSLVSGQTAIVSAAGAVTISATASALASSFTSAGLNTVANASSPFAGGVTSGAAASSGGSAVIAGVGAAGIVSAVAVQVAASAATSTPAPASAPMSTPTPTPTPTPTATPTLAPTPAPSPSGAITIGGHARTLQSATSIQPPSAPTAAPGAHPGLSGAGLPPFAGPHRP